MWDRCEAKGDRQYSLPPLNDKSDGLLYSWQRFLQFWEQEERNLGSLPPTNGLDRPDESHEDFPRLTKGR